MIDTGTIWLVAQVLMFLYNVGRYGRRILSYVTGASRLGSIINNSIIEVAEEHTIYKPFDMIEGFFETPEIAKLIEDAGKLKLTDNEINERLSALEGKNKDMLSEVIERVQEKIKLKLSNGDKFILEAVADVRVESRSISHAVSESSSITITKLDGIEDSLELLHEKFDSKEVSIIASILDEAKRYIDSSEYEKAEVPLRQLDQFSERISEADLDFYYNYWGCVHLGLNNPLDSIECFEKAIEIGDEPKYKKNLLNALVASKLPGNLDRAEGIFSEIRDEEIDANYHNALGNYHLLKKERDEAYRSFMKAKELEPDLIHVRLNLCHLYLDFGEFEEFKEEMSKVEDVIGGEDVNREIKYHYHSTKARYYIMEILASGHYELKDEKNGYVSTMTLDVPDELKAYASDALREYELASHVALTFERVEVALKKSFCYVVLQQYRNAKNVLELLVDEELPEEHRSILLTNLGNIYSVLGDYEKAEDTFRRKIDKFGETDDDLLFLARSILRVGPRRADFQAPSAKRGAEAISIYEKLLDKDRKNEIILCDLGIVYLLLKEYDVAIEMFKGLTDDEIRLKNLGSTYLSKKDYGNAIVCFSEFTELFPQEPTGFWALGEALGLYILTSGVTEILDEAIGHLEALKESEPTAYRQLEILCDLYLKKEDYENALDLTLLLIGSGCVSREDLLRLKHNKVWLNYRIYRLYTPM